MSAKHPKFKSVVRWEMKPDLYAGDNCDEAQPRWWGYADGDKEGGFDDEVVLKPENYPSGAVVQVLLPCCPQCHADVEMCKLDKHCDFDWDHWTECEYS